MGSPTTKKPKKNTTFKKDTRRKDSPLRNKSHKNQDSPPHDTTGPQAAKTKKKDNKPTESPKGKNNNNRTKGKKNPNGAKPQKVTKKCPLTATACRKFECAQHPRHDLTRTNKIP